ncbi:ComEC/Rec2 family competence protein [Pleurocapsales cyanobacterium LEGE 06147]|nr:ComEC/Rec2 family competence protein [Pleurocapsales cyanobacterium LEGE 06147]
MNRHSWIILCLAYVAGLLSTSLLTFLPFDSFWQEIAIVATGLGGLSIVASVISARFGYAGASSRIWLGAGVVAILAVIYLQLRIPQPGVNDISHRVTEGFSQQVTVEGKVLTEPRLTSTGQIKFWFWVSQLTTGNDNENAATSGKLYVTVPLLQGTGIYPRENLSIQGILYRPQPATNPGGFDFRAYLARQGTFAGLKGNEVLTSERQKPTWGLWQLRQRIVRANLVGLGSPAGQLVSSMVLGRKAVDLPEDIRDRFIRNGLAHVLAASGFHVSLLLGMVLRLSDRFSVRSRLIIGASTLVIYIGLTGLQPSVMRAGLMGIGVLIALATNSKVRALGSLLLAATILLLLNPLWIWDLGFQLSFLATWGLLVTAPALYKRLDWLPPTIATAIAIPLAASIWTLPLLCYVFNTVATYSIVVNIISTPLITIISLGGMIGVIAALIIPAIGSAIAWLLLYPTLFLIEITKFFTNLPGSAFIVGKISLGLVIILYGLIGLVWLSSWWRSRWWLVLLFAVTLIIVPISYSRLNSIQVTVLATQQEQVVVVRDRGKIILINSGEANTAKYTVLPFLTRQGIDRIDCGLALDDRSRFQKGWSVIHASLPITSFVGDLTPQSTINIESTKLTSADEAISFGSTNMRLISNDPAVVQLQIHNYTWLILSPSIIEKKTDVAKYIKQNNFDTSFLALLWSGEKIPHEWLRVLKPQVAIASTTKIEENLQQQLQQQQTQLYWTGRDGAIRWIPGSGFETNLIREEDNSFV